MKGALITGAGSGLGLELVKDHIKNGWTVFALTHHISEKLESIQKKHPAQLEILLCDVASMDSVSAAMEKIKERTAVLDRIFNNAGINRSSEWAPLDRTDLDAVLEEYTINAVGPLRVIKAALPFLNADTVIVNISSEAAGIEEQTLTGGYGYCMSKAALNMGTKILDNWLKGKGTRIFAIHPGRMRTGMGGPDSNIDPWDSSREIMSFLDRAASLPRGHLFYDYQGNALKW